VLVASNGYEGYPPRWAEFRQVHTLVSVLPGFRESGAVNRFAARYRLAKACTVTLQGYSPSTTAGYNSMVRVALSWSAFEALLGALDKQNDFATVSARHDLSVPLATMRKAGNARPFFEFVAKELTSKVQRQHVLDFIEAKPCCGLTLAKAIRHIFFHGTLTPSAGQAESAAVATACGLLADAVRNVMDIEFRSALDTLLGAAKEAFPPHPNY
jgi:hypothetical protein